MRAAMRSGLPTTDLAEIERAIDGSRELDAALVGGMSDWDRLATYAIAAWLAQVGEARDDGAQTTYHAFWSVRALVTLGDLLSLPPPARKRLAAVAYEIARLPDGERPDEYDFSALAVEVVRRMPPDA